MPRESAIETVVNWGRQGYETLPMAEHVVEQHDVDKSPEHAVRLLIRDAIRAF
jgi:hypothetical protein